MAGGIGGLPGGTNYIPPLALKAIGVIVQSLFPELPGIGLLVVAVVWILEQIISALIPVGVPHDAKTIGTAGQLIHSNNAILQHMGVQMLLGGKVGRVISESNTPSFEQELAHVTGGLVSWSNHQPNGSYWPSIYKADPKYAPDAVTYNLKPIPPPHGAPYSQSVGPYVQALKPLSPQEYEKRYGHTVPSAQEIEKFLESTDWPRYGDKIIRQSIRDHNLENVAKLWHDRFTQWKGKNEPGPGPGGCNDDCLQLVVTAVADLTAAVAAITQAIKDGAGGPDETCCKNVVAALDRITSTLKETAGKSSGTDLKPLIDELEKFRAGTRDPVTDALIRKGVSDGTIDPQVGQQLLS